MYLSREFNVHNSLYYILFDKYYVKINFKESRLQLTISDTLFFLSQKIALKNK